MTEFRKTSRNYGPQESLTNIKVEPYDSLYDIVMRVGQATKIPKYEVGFFLNNNKPVGYYSSDIIQDYRENMERQLAIDPLPMAENWNFYNDVDYLTVTPLQR